MRKNLFSWMAFVALVVSLSFTSCSKEDTAKPVNEPDFMAHTATIVGYVEMNRDLTVTPVVYSFPKQDEFKMFVTIPYSYLIKGDATGRVWTTTDVNYDPQKGKFTITVPFGFAGSKVSFSMNDFAGTQKRTESGVVVDKTVIWKWGAVRQADVTWEGQTVYLSETPIYLTAVPYTL